MTNKQLKHIQSLLGLSALNITFKAHDSQFKTSLGECWGLCTAMNNEYRIDYTYSNDHRKAVKTLLHELCHVFQFENDRELCCVNADIFADDMIDYILGEL